MRSVIPWDNEEKGKIEKEQPTLSYFILTTMQCVSFGFASYMAG